jgi:cell division protein FtsQ
VAAFFGNKNKADQQAPSMGRRVKPADQEQEGNGGSSRFSRPDVKLPKGILGITLLLGLSAVIGWYWMKSVRVQQVEFSGQHFATVEELQQQISIPENAHPDSIDFMGLMESVESIPYVKQAEISVNPSGTMEVTVHERQPIAMLADGDDKVYVDAQGIKLDIRTGKAVNVPVLYGFPAQPMSDTLQSNAFRQTAAFLREVRGNTFADATLSEIAWTPDEGIVAMSHENGVKLVFGKAGYSERLRNWEAFYRQVVRRKGIARMRTVDLRFNGQIVTRENNRTS